ncbi:sigma factor-like helix-turn-helix DNA-binding protein [Streptomyces sp. NPDC018947]|uniref:sigma factor-like helix-turn-helix DNA-binding protein n=1 Tax=Streptomyces sp. NPDC018947 TaxID=3365054 RepID=UPI0037B49A9B
MPPTHDVLPAGHDFAAYARTHWPRLVATARLLTDDPGAAEELVRTTLVRMCARWRRVPRDDVDFHVLRCLLRGYLRPWRRGRRTARRRAVLVLRIREGLADAEIAQVLGCSPGTVRAQARHGLRAAGPDSGTATEQLREAYARAVGELVPSPAPLDDLQAQGRASGRRRIAVASAACAALLTPVALLCIDRLEGGGTRAGASDAGARAGSATSPVRVVALGERVTIGPGLQVWLSADDGHWSAPVAAAGGGIHHALDEPGVSMRVDTVRQGFFLSGLFRGLHGDPSRVEVRTRGGSLTAKVIVLAGSPGWGLWYTSAPLPVKDMTLSMGMGGLSVTVYDASGKAVAGSKSTRGRT